MSKPRAIELLWFWIVSCAGGCIWCKPWLCQFSKSVRLEIAGVIRNCSNHKRRENLPQAWMQTAFSGVRRPLYEVYSSQQYIWSTISPKALGFEQQHSFQCCSATSCSHSNLSCSWWWTHQAGNRKRCEQCLSDQRNSSRELGEPSGYHLGIP